MIALRILAAVAVVIVGLAAVVYAAFRDMDTDPFAPSPDHSHHEEHRP